MKISVFHDGSGNFTNKTVQNGGETEADAAMQLMLASVAEGIGQALLFKAGMQGRPMGRFKVSVEAVHSLEDIHAKGLDVEVEAQVPRETLEELVNAALSHCFPEGSPACPVRHSVIALS